MYGPSFHEKMKQRKRPIGELPARNGRKGGALGGAAKRGNGNPQQDDRGNRGLFPDMSDMGGLGRKRNGEGKGEDLIL